MRHLDGQHMLQSGSFRRASGYAPCYDVYVTLMDAAWASGLQVALSCASHGESKPRWMACRSP